jgi:2-polyprenyl-6-methoxyphenol hydroxylase-like FAD-dependent oxidoreductase
VLTAELAADFPGSLQQGLARYSARRRLRVRRVQDQADRLAKLSAFRNPAAGRIRDAVVRLAGRVPGTSARLSRIAQQEDPADLYRSLVQLTKQK